MTEEILIQSIYGTGTNENFSIIIPQCRKFKLIEASIPISFDNILAGSITLHNTSVGSKTINIAAGRYTQSSLAASLQTGITSAPNPLPTYTVSVDLNFKFTFATSSSDLFTVDATNLTELNMPILQVPASSQTGNSTVSIFQAQYIFIFCEQVVGCDNGTIVPGSIGTNILHAIPLCASGILNYRAYESAPWVQLVHQFSTTPITMNFYINTFATATSLDNFSLNGGVWSMKLLLTN